ncbi:MAG: hypothetical protein QOC93_256 [Actinomycetota bacterium]|nr:hypothetical protein [Actinomycetota bacterium]
MPEFGFDGLEPWDAGAKLTECRADGQRFDLRGDATFLGYDFGEYGMLTLRWLHDDGTRGSERVTLDFDNLRAFIAVPGDPNGRLAGETEGWDYWPGSPGRANVTVYAGDSNLSFSCGGVRLRIEAV